MVDFESLIRYIRREDVTLFIGSGFSLKAGAPSAYSLVQAIWSLESNNEGAVTINEEGLTYGYGEGSGTLELYSTKNMYQFILLNNSNGIKWHVQWGIKDKKDKKYNLKDYKCLNKQ